MENFIKKIFEIDDEADDYQKSFENKKNALIKEREEKLKALNDEYKEVLEAEKNYLQTKINEIESNDINHLDDYKNKAQEIRQRFFQKKSELIEDIAKSILEGGD